MIISEVTEQDCKSLLKVLTIIQAGEYSLGGKEICAAADTMRWVQDLAQKFAASYSSKTSDKPASVPVAEAVPSDPPLPGLGDVKIKAFSPGKIGKK